MSCERSVFGLLPTTGDRAATHDYTSTRHAVMHTSIPFEIFQDDVHTIQDNDHNTVTSSPFDHGSSHSNSQRLRNNDTKQVR
jgi:hypothetical protein